MKDDGTYKAKARAILILNGYQDPGYEHRATTTQVMTRQTRSTQGIFIGIAPLGLLQGKMECVTPIGWHATKIDSDLQS